MTAHTYIAYKRADELRVARIVEALERSGVAVWWDRELAGGESWHERLTERVAHAGCVVVVWTEASTGPGNQFVRDEASRGLARDILVPVLLDPVPIPLGFGDLQAIDLTRWKGSARDPFFRDLVAAVEAKLAGAPVPPPAGPTARLRRRLAYGVSSGAGLAMIASLGFNTFGLAARVCTAPGLQPALSDGCGAIGVGERATRTERLAWAGLPKGECAALRSFVQRFPEGVHRSEAADLLTARRTWTEDRWTPVTRALPLFQPPGPPASSRASAQAAALRAAQPAADRLCRGFGSGTLFRFVSARPRAEHWSCDATGCGFDGVADCTLSARREVTRESCGAALPPARADANGAKRLGV